MWMFCEHLTVAKGPLFFWSYCFYVSKYYEMLDTVLSICRRSSMPHFYFHVYHHCVVPVLILGQRYSLEGLVANTLTHVAMYAYYALKVAGVPTPYKILITYCQVFQFLTGIACMLPNLYCWYLEELPCSGEGMLVACMLINGTFLGQFASMLLPQATAVADAPQTLQTGGADEDAEDQACLHAQRK